ncbi:hypothetical protein [Ponticaulis profundi]|uniref:Uncharacterized protein n=1 Tax=Ponticaulis profundi TaxID=2665222 RepID=A0ABW1S6V2_9PROT
MQLKQIVLRLARNPGFPEGDHDQGYVIVAPLDNDARLDTEAWRDVKKHCTVRRFHTDDSLKADGFLTHRGSNWYFHYDEESEGPDEPLYKLADHQILHGSYVTIAHGDDEDALTYQIDDIRNVEV